VCRCGNLGHNRFIQRNTVLDGFFPSFDRLDRHCFADLDLVGHGFIGYRQNGSFLGGIGFGNLVLIVHC
jgi:hypothetical protein